MGPKSRVYAIYFVLIIFLLGSFTLPDFKADTDGDDDYKMIAMFLHGDPENATLNTTDDDDVNEYHVLTTGPQDTPLTTIPIGEWVTEPIAYPMNIKGLVQFLIFAKGNLEDVRFTGYLTVNGVDVSNPMTTDAQDLNESETAMYISTQVNISTPLELNFTDTIGIRLNLQHNDPRYYQFNPPPGVGKNVSLVMGGFEALAQVVFSANSMKVTEITGVDDSSSGNIMVTATIKCSFGIEDFNFATAKSDYGKLLFVSEEFLDESTVEYVWEWDYTATEGGSYEVTVTARDQSFNSWKKSEDIHITTPNTEVDFAVGKSTISFSNDPQQSKNTTIKAKITGGGKRWNSYQVDVEFYDNSELIEVVSASISRGKTNIVSAVWIPDSGGTHSIKVVVDPEDEIPETNEVNNEVSKSVDVGGSGNIGTPGFEAPILFAAFAIIIVLTISRLRKK